mmetsp:Transcript_22616/g.19635  ORF Transcript_22616/g.19635 Transcript_22616/m.19635 type:complete len:133 (-) Transcript_22616:26-424(-)
MYYKDANVAILVYDVTCKESFENLTYWIEELQTNGPDKLLIYIAGNKTDLTDKEEVDTIEAANYAEKNKATFKPVSAKLNIGIKELFTIISDDIHNLNKGLPTSHSKDAKKLKSKNSTGGKSGKSIKGCCKS